MTRACRQAGRWILLQADGETSMEDDFRLEAHLRSCAACAAEQQRVRTLEGALQGLDAPNIPRLNVEVSVEAIRTRLALGVGSEDPRLRRRSNPIRWMAGAASVLFAGMLWWALVCRQQEEAGLERSAGGLVGDAALQGQRTPEAVPLDPDPSEQYDELLVLSDVRAYLRSALASAAIEQEPELVAARVEASFAAWSPVWSQAGTRYDWDLPRFVEELVGDPDSALAAAAVRYLAARGDRLSIPTLRTAIDKAALTADAFGALASLGDAVTPVLQELLAEPDRASDAIDALVAIGSRRAAQALEHQLASSPSKSWGSRARGVRNSEVGRQRLIEGLARLGPPATESLVRLAMADHLPTAEAVSIVARNEQDAADGGATRELERMVASDLGASVPVLLLFLEEMQSPLLLTTVEELCESYDHEQQALAALSRWRGPAVLEALLRLDARGRVMDEDLAHVLHVRLDSDGALVADFARVLVRERREADARRLLDLLILSEHPASAAGLAVLGLADLLTRDLRQTALLAITGLGRTADIEELLERLRTRPPDDGRLFACGLVGVHGAHGREAAETVLVDASPRGRARVLDALTLGQERGSITGSLTRVSRALDSAWTDSYETWQGLP